MIYELNFNNFYIFEFIIRNGILLYEDMLTNVEEIHITNLHKNTYFPYDNNYFMSENTAYKLGTRDGANGRNYREPHGVIATLLNSSAIRENEAYKRGYNYGKGQRDGFRNKYESYRSQSKEYNKGIDNGRNQYKSKSKSNCFVTTATLNSVGKSDNCEELTAFRNFRDEWVIFQPKGVDLIKLYYRIAPLIVRAIDKECNNEDIYLNLWQNNIQPCHECIKQGRFEEAKLIYLNTISDLINKFKIKI